MSFLSEDRRNEARAMKVSPSTVVLASGLYPGE